MRAPSGLSHTWPALGIALFLFSLVLLHQQDARDCGVCAGLQRSGRVYLVLLVPLKAPLLPTFDPKGRLKILQHHSFTLHFC